MGALQPWHLIVLAIVVVALFGYNKLPDVTRSVGRSLRIFKTEMKGLSEDDKVRDEAQAQGQATVAPPVSPVPMQKEVEPLVATPTAPGTPSDAEIARAEAVLAAAAKARSEAAASNGAGPAPERADSAAH